MSDEQRPRRYNPPTAPETPTGYRQSRRGSKSMKSAKKAERQHKVVSAFDRFYKGLRTFVYVVAWVAGVTLFGVLLVLLAITTVNTVARWNAKRVATSDAAQEARDRQRVKEDVLVIGADGDTAAGFLALRVDKKGNQVFGIAIPEGAFIDVPGQGFERVGEALSAGPESAASAVSNFLGVPFTSYLVVPTSAYTAALTNQNVSGLTSSIQETNLTGDDLSDLTGTLAKMPPKNVALVPMPVKPIKVGDQTYFEPQRDEIADLLKQWWGVTGQEADNVVRAIVYNGAGKPGIAGEAAQVLIRSGVRVVDTKNADNFNYDTTRIVVRNGDAERGEAIRQALGVGIVTVEPSSEDIADVIIIIGKDYSSPAGSQKGAQ